MIEENAALSVLRAKLASQEMDLAQIVDAKQPNGANSRQADVEDAVREIVASEIKRHHSGVKRTGC